MADKSRTESYTPPKNVVEPAKGDKGYFMVYKEFRKRKSKFKPGISWSFSK